MNRLYLVSNSIGNDEDLPPRTKTLLEEADWIIGEEQRTTSTFLKKLGVSKPFDLVNEHTSRQEMDEIAMKLATTKRTCMISDSGSPGLEDPGKWLVPLAWEMGVEVRSAPGPTALVAALTSSGFATSPFLFLGFLPREEKERERTLKQYLGLGITIAFYETPYRAKHCLETLAKILPGDRQIFLALGISMANETSFRGTAKEIHKKFPQGLKLPPVFVVEEKKERIKR
ncbi:methyltransferase [Leptospira bourretii]|uniref:16S rRNA (cytidine(1402)-2'-O)-methyltransferase n=1 Tax=Leptospira bourretii TaxID=2484962 RepID=UPI001090B8A0|nr:SAM-dependent methyltransferase [Leptospira bourretii]TGL23284.1 methyltransferase [Leptospira bourretii]